MNNNSLPIGFEKLKTEKPYINLGKLPEGEHRFRIVDRPIAGWIDWVDRKPCRFKPEDKPKSSFDPQKPVKPFWAMHVWDYEKEGLFIMEVTQNGIRRSLEDYATNEDWGDLTSYDIKIKKEGSGIDTKYSVIPVPPKPVSKEIKEAVSSTQVRLEALYEGKDPWTDLDVMEEHSKDELTHEQLDRIEDLLRSFPSEQAEKFICHRLGIKDIFKVPLEKFSGVIKFLEDEISKQKGERREQLA